MLGSLAVIGAIMCTTPTPPTGWEWEAEPEELQPNQNELLQMGDTGTFLAHWGDGTFVARFVESKAVEDEDSARNGRGNAYKIVVITDENELVEYSSNSSMGNLNQKVHQWMNKPVDPATASSMGVLRRTEEGSRIISKQAVAEARSKGIDVLPLAVVGQTFDFDLPSLDGGRISTGDYQGKFVLIDNWATWCGPCMAKMPELRALNDTWKSKGLQVIGIDWDRDIEKGKKAIEQEEQTWPQVNPFQFASEHQALWSQACGIDALPYLVLLDKKGRVMAAGRPHHVLEMTEKAMTGKLLPPPPQPNIPSGIPDYTREQIQGMSVTQLRSAIVEVSQARKLARGNRQLEDSLNNQFDMLLDDLKSKSASN